MNIPGSQRLKIVALSVTLGVALFGIWARFYYYRGRRTRARSVKGSSGAKTAARAVSPPGSSLRGGSLSKQSSGRNCAGASNSERTLGNPTQEAFINLGLENLTQAIQQWESATKLSEFKGGTDHDLIMSFGEILEQARVLQESVTRYVQRHCTPNGICLSSTGVGGDHAILLEQSGGHVMRKTMSILSDDSYVSALEDLIPIFPAEDVLLREALAIPVEELAMYQLGLIEARSGRVPCRLLRTEFTGCAMDEEFLAKLYCIRESLHMLLSDERKRIWLADMGKALIAELMEQANKDSTDFAAAYDRLLEYVKDESVWPDIEEELRSRQVVMFSFYDVVLDFILMDAFDDLARPPASVLAVAQNRFLSATFKESTLGTVVWSVIKAKRTRLQKSNGFISRFYDISEQVSPTMAWGFLGTNEKLRDMCYYFKEQISNFMLDVFSFERVRYTTLGELSDDIWQFCQRRVEMTQQRFSLVDLST